MERVGAIAAQAGIGGQFVDSRNCACGGVIGVVEPVTDERILLAVQRHQRDHDHKAWLHAGGIWAMAIWRPSEPPFRLDIPARGTVLEHGYRLPVED